MPLYEYMCSKCGLKFELLRPISQSNEEASCPHCQNRAERAISSFACFSKDESGLNAPVGGSSCASCSATSCSSCHL